MTPLDFSEEMTRNSLMCLIKKCKLLHLEAFFIFFPSNIQGDHVGTSIILGCLASNDLIAILQPPRIYPLYDEEAFHLYELVFSL